MQNQNQGQPQPININPEDTTGVACPQCQSEFFIPVYMLRKVSALLSPSGREETIQVPVMACANCGQPNVPEGFEIKEDTSTDENTEGDGEEPQTEGDGSRIITP